MSVLCELLKPKSDSLSVLTALANKAGSDLK